MPRDPNTGKPRGFAWLMYADQRSTVLAVDNLNGAQVLGRTLRVDHVLNYKQLERDQETGKLKERDEQRYVDLQLVPLYRTDARSPISFAAHPEKFLKGRRIRRVRERLVARLDRSRRPHARLPHLAAAREEKETQGRGRRRRQQRIEGREATQEGRTAADP